MGAFLSIRTSGLNFWKIHCRKEQIFPYSPAKKTTSQFVPKLKKHYDGNFRYFRFPPEFLKFSVHCLYFVSFNIVSRGESPLLTMVLPVFGSPRDFRTIFLLFQEFRNLWLNRKRPLRLTTLTFLL